MRPEVHFHFAFDEIDGHSKIDSEFLTFAEVTKSDDEIDEHKVWVDWNLGPELWHFLPRIRAERERVSTGTANATWDPPTRW